ncbi:MAG: hypothetical protein ACP5JG_17480 [Anaerolineae bacterium]
MSKRSEQTRTEVKVIHGAPTLCLNGEPVPALAYFWSACAYAPTAEEREGERRRLMRQMRDAGVHVYMHCPYPGWNAPGAYDPSTPPPHTGRESIDTMVQRVLEVDPEGYFIPRVSTAPPWSWVALHREEMEVIDGAVDMVRQVSWASDLWLHEAGEMLTAFVDYCESQPWGDRVFAYHVDGPSGEWCPRSAMIGQYGDYSRPMRAWFQAWLRRKYGDEATLREAWNDRNVTFETATVPSPRQQRETGFFRYRDPREETQVIDYYRAVRDRSVHDIRTLAGVAKGACERRKVVGVFYGYEPAMYWSPALFFGENDEMAYSQASAQRSGHMGLSRVAECEDIDYIASPYDYLYRTAGGVGASQSLPYSIALRGKVFWTEDDTRTHTSPRTIWYGRTRNDAESVAVLRRNFAGMITDNASLWWMDQQGRWFDTPEIHAAIQDMVKVASRLPELDRRPWGEIGVFLDEDGAFYTELENNYGWAEVYKQRLFGLAGLGAPYRLHTLRDLALDNLPDYKLWIFLEAHVLDAETRQLIQKRCKRDGNVLVWHHGAGLIDEGPSVENMTELTGIKFLMRETPWEHIVAINNWRHPITRGLPRDLVYGTDRMSGPVLLVWDDEATELGLGIYNNGVNETALAIKEFGKGARGASDGGRGPEDWASVYSSAPNLPGALLRGLARYAGCHIYCDTGDQIHADRRFVAIHTAAGGPTTIRLPHVAPVRDVFGRHKLGDALRQFTVDLPRTSTTLFYLGDEDLLAD